MKKGRRVEPLRELFKDEVRDLADAAKGQYRLMLGMARLASLRR
jgi:GMP synthase PP-ATPase subunit